MRSTSSSSWGWWCSTATAVTTREHQRIAAAIERNDPDEAEAAMRAHLTEARERHLATFGKE